MPDTSPEPAEPAAPARPTEPESAPAPAAAPKPADGAEIDEADKPFLLMAYMGPLAGFSLMGRAGSPLVVFHAKQGLTFTAVLLAYAFVEIILAQVPYLGPLVWATGFLVWPVAVGLVPFAIVQAFDGRRWPIPGVSTLAAKW
jgi:uncharacterized membrane protein